MDILVKVSTKRKCAASIDVINAADKTVRLSFGDLETPETDVEVDFTLDQLRELNAVSTKALTDLEQAIEERARMLERIERDKKRREHYGSC